ASNATTPQSIDIERGLAREHRLATETAGARPAEMTRRVAAQGVGGAPEDAAVNRAPARDVAHAAVAMREQPERADGAGAMPIRPVVSRAIGSTRGPDRPYSDDDSRPVEAPPRAVTTAVERRAPVAPPAQLIWRRAADGTDGQGARSAHRAS